MSDIVAWTAGALLQAGAAVRTIPWELPAIAMTLGFVLVTVAVITMVGRERSAVWRRSHSRQRQLMLVAAVVGIVIGAGTALVERRLVWYYAALLLLLGRIIEGSLIARMGAKILSLLTNSSGSLTQTIVGKLRARLVRIILTSIITATMLSVIAFAFLRNSTRLALAWTALAYTVGRIGIVAVVVLYQLKDIASSASLSLYQRAGLVGGLVLSLAGAEVFDFPPALGLVTIPSRVLQNPLGELLVNAGTWIGLIIGILIGSMILVRSIGTK